MHIGLKLNARPLAVGLFVSTVAFAAEPPVVPGYNRLKDEAKASAAQLGQVLIGELNCTQCHSTPDAKRLITNSARTCATPARMTPQYLRKYILSPHEVKPGSTMPDLFHVSEAQAKAGAAEYLTQYLVSLGGPIKPSEEDGNTLLVEQGRKLFQSVGCVACHSVEKARR